MGCGASNPPEAEAVPAAQPEAPAPETPAAAKAAPAAQPEAPAPETPSAAKAAPAAQPEAPAPEEIISGAASIETPSQSDEQLEGAPDPSDWPVCPEDLNAANVNFYDDEYKETRTRFMELVHEGDHEAVAKILNEQLLTKEQFSFKLEFDGNFCHWLFLAFQFCLLSTPAIGKRKTLTNKLEDVAAEHTQGRIPLIKAVQLVEEHLVATTTLPVLEQVIQMSLLLFDPRKNPYICRPENGTQQQGCAGTASGAAAAVVLPHSCPWQLDFVRAVLRGTHDPSSPFHQLKAQHGLLELIIRRWAWPDIGCDSISRSVNCGFPPRFAARDDALLFKLLAKDKAMHFCGAATYVKTALCTCKQFVLARMLPAAPSSQQPTQPGRVLQEPQQTEDVDEESPRPVLEDVVTKWRRGLQLLQESAGDEDVASGAPDEVVTVAEVELLIDKYSTGIACEKLWEVLEGQLDIDIQVVDRRLEKYGLDDEQKAAAEKTRATERRVYDGDDEEESYTDEDESEEE